jgi:hypothetical protein
MKEKKLFLLLAGVLSFFSCNNQAVLPVEEEKVIEVIRDIHIAEAAMQNLLDITKDSMGDIYYQQIFEIHGMNKADFDSSMIILRRDPERLGIIYDKVLQELEEMNDTLFTY